MIHGDEDNNVSSQGSKPSVNPNQGAGPDQQQVQIKNQYVGVANIGFGSSIGNLPILNTNKGSEYTTQFVAFLKEAFEKNFPVKSKQPNIVVLDNAIKQQLAYSSVIVSVLLNAKVNYFVILLEATGRGPVRASAMASEIYNAEKMPMQGNRGAIKIFTADDGIDKVLHNEISQAILEQYGDAVGINPVDGIVIPARTQPSYDFCHNIAAVAYNACFLEYTISSGQLKDINIANAKNASGQSFLRIESNMSRVQMKNLVGEPVRSDFAIKLIESPLLNGNYQSLNLGETPHDLSVVTGYVDAIPTPVPVQTMPGGPVGSVLRMRPNVIITSINPAVPTLGYALLGLVSSLVMTNQNMWLACVTPKDKHNTGALNLFTNLEANPNNIGAVLDLSPKERSLDETYAVLKQMYLQDVMVTLDVPSFGPETSYLSAFAVAAQAGQTKAKTVASNDIIKTAHELTNGGFPLDFPANEIFVGGSVNVPTGTWFDKTGERDIRDIDLPFILTQPGDIGLANEWAFSNITSTGKDPYVEKVKVIAKVIPDAEISRKAIRVTFTPKFIMTLAEAARSAGLDAKFEPEVVFAETTNYDLMSAYYGSTGVSNASGFARQHFNAGNGFNYSPYANVGFGRY